jgi:DNA-binding winged helix-turn-helix (wHTH) protein
VSEASGTEERALENIFRFASFEADRDRYQLRHRGRRVKVERIPLELLFLLLEHHGKVVTREQIMERLWGSNQLLDAERSTNTAIRKVRRALKDHPRHPRYVETVVGKGYRFVGPRAEGAEDAISPAGVVPGPEPAGLAEASGQEVTLREFALELQGEMAALSCEILCGGLPLGRIQLASLRSPYKISMPLDMEDRLLMKLLAIDVSLAPEASQSLRSLCVSLLQAGIPMRTEEPLPRDRGTGRAAAVASVA